MSRSSILFLASAAALLGVVLGLGVLRAEAGGSQSQAGTALPYRFLDPLEMTVPLSSSGRPKPVTTGENFAANRGSLESDSLEIVVPPRSWVEYKAVMDQGDSLVYSWSAEGGELVYDFHADLPEPSKQFFTRYRRGQETRDGGSIVAAYSGLHGWYWKNVGDKPATIQLEVAGFYDEIIVKQP